jgi:hypothetical protein
VSKLAPRCYGVNDRPNRPTTTEQVAKDAFEKTDEPMEHAFSLTEEAAAIRACRNHIRQERLMPYEKAVNPEYLTLAATRLVFPGGRIIGRRLIPDKGFRLVQDPKTRSVKLMKDDGTGVGGLVCECGLEGGGCDIAILNPGDIDESAVCVPVDKCGSSGLFCFMGLTFAGGLSLKFAM